MLIASPARALNCQDYRDIGDVLRIALPAAAYGLTLGYWDGQGALQYTKTLAYTGAATGFFKVVGEKHRPNASTSQQSFVSGHVSAAMSGAAFIYTRYGKGWGIPAYLLAGVTAYSRGCAQAHFDDDILGGTMVALMSNWYATSPHPGQMRIYPSFTSNELTLSWSALFGGNRQPREPANFTPRYRFLFEFGPLKQEKNIIQSPTGVGTTIDFAQLEKKSAATARVLFEYYPKGKPKQDWSVYYSPLGITDFEDPTQPFDFAGVTFDPADGGPFNSNYRWFDFRARWRTALVKNDKWTVRLGAGLQYTYTKVDIEQGQVSSGIINFAEVSTDNLFPVVHGSVDYNFTPRWSIAGQLDGMSEFWASDDAQYYWNAGLFLQFEATPLWSLGIGGRWIFGKTVEPELFNEFESRDITFQLGRSF